MNNKPGDPVTMRLFCPRVVVFLVICVLSACSATPRPTPPSEGALLEDPWGSVPFQTAADGIDSKFTEAMMASLLAKREQMREAGDESRIPLQ